MGLQMPTKHPPDAIPTAPELRAVLLHRNGLFFAAHGDMGCFFIFRGVFGSQNMFSHEFSRAYS